MSNFLFMRINLNYIFDNIKRSTLIRINHCPTIDTFRPMNSCVANNYLQHEMKVNIFFIVFIFISLSQLENLTNAMTESKGTKKSYDKSTKKREQNQKNKKTTEKIEIYDTAQIDFIIVHLLCMFTSKTF